MNAEKITTIHVVDAIEPLLPLYRDRLGFTVLVEVPEGDALGFVILASGGAQLMLQTKASLEKDLPKVAALGPSTLTYVDTRDLDACVRAMAGQKMLGEVRTTFYGAKEAWFQLDSGHVVGYAHHAPA